jgi:hypothetical protein
MCTQPCQVCSRLSASLFRLQYALSSGHPLLRFIGRWPPPGVRPATFGHKVSGRVTARVFDIRGRDMHFCSDADRAEQPGGRLEVSAKASLRLPAISRQRRTEYIRHRGLDSRWRDWNTYRHSVGNGMSPAAREHQAWLEATPAALEADLPCRNVKLRKG